MRTTFKNLDIGQRFEFVIKSDLCDGFYNGIGIKLSRLDYRMSGENVTIFDVNAAVFEVESAKLASAAVPVLTMESAAKIMGLKIRPGEPDDLTIAQLIRQRADLLAALVDCRDCLIATRDSGRSDALTDWQKRAIGAGYEAMQSSGYPNAQDTSAKGGI
jgi:hypothetical protein